MCNRGRRGRGERGGRWLEGEGNLAKRGKTRRDIAVNGRKRETDWDTEGGSWREYSFCFVLVAGGNVGAERVE